MLLALGVVTGMRHALEADHLAAVVAMSTQSRSRWATVWRGVAWGTGHTVSLLAIGGACLAAGVTISAGLERWFERVVGLMLIAIGGSLLVRMRRQRIHVHVHAHTGGVVHAHAHAHAPGGSGRPGGAHDHRHPVRGHLRALTVGMVHGVAGTAAILVLTATATGNLMLGLAYIAAFGVGSIVGMAVLSAVVAVPLAFSAHRLQSAYRLVEFSVAAGTVLLGAWMLQ